MMNSTIKSKKESFRDFFSRFLGEEVLTIPDYQREYVWKLQNFKRLAADLVEESQLEEYYLGNIVLHEEKVDGVCKVNIVDGQQRLTTLLVFDYVLKGEKSFLANKQNSICFQFLSKTSRYNIRQCQDYATSLTGDLKSKLELAVEKVVFVCLITNSEDQAFALFDSQNNRGIKPKVADLLKAIHLRSILNNVKLQEESAVDWERIEKYESNSSTLLLPWHKLYFMPEFLQTIIWRNRTWRYGSFSYASDDTLEQEFYANLKESSDNSVQLYYLRYPYKVSCNGKDIIEATPYVLPEHLKDFPITLRQPLKKGITFFRYISKYFDSLRFIFESKEQTLFQEFFTTVYKAESIFMIQAFVTACIAFTDKFGFDQLLKFSCYWDYATGHLRQFSYRIVEDRFPKYLAKRQLLDKVFSCFTVDELCEELAEEVNEEPGSISQPMLRYNKSCLKYYNLEYTDNLELGYEIKLQALKLKFPLNA